MWNPRRNGAYDPNGSRCWEQRCPQTPRDSLQRGRRTNLSFPGPFSCVLSSSFSLRRLSSFESQLCFCIFWRFCSSIFTMWDMLPPCFSVRSSGIHQKKPDLCPTLLSIFSHGHVNHDTKMKTSFRNGRKTVHGRRQKAWALDAVVCSRDQHLHILLIWRRIERNVKMIETQVMDSTA